MPTQPRILKRRDLPSLAKYIKSDKCKRVVLMVCLDKVNSPDASKLTRLKLNLPHPEAVFEIHFFRENPEPFYTLAHELFPGRFRPTLTHSFVRLLAEKGLLHQCFTQNIDTLERRAGVPGDKVIEAHGSFATQRCIDCKTPYDDERMKKHILAKNIARCDRCKGLVKPDIVFFGESLPEEFIQAVPKVSQADLLIVIGTSLTVHPFASLAGMSPSHCPRVLINLDRVGDFGSHLDDVVLLGKCDEIIRDLATELGWLDELMELWDATEESVEESRGVENEGEAGGKDEKEKTEPLPADEEVEKLTAAIEQSLTVNQKDEEEQEQAPVVKAESDSPAAPAEKIKGADDLLKPEPPAMNATPSTEKKEPSNTSAEKEKL
ncbi:Sir2 family histone deacetylase Hst2 [Coprinopsis sp. MPI-PUGE-AT-0042]|nr:Sir2 family histone deacetylase Hst2 [Coprinopsis sp. MPI-PUGE-AT-0042]